jgi:acetyltransferase
MNPRGELVRKSASLPMSHNLRALVSPASVAVVGASERAAHFANLPLTNLGRFKFGGTIYPVNPKYSEIMGHRCYPSLRDLPSVPDMVAIAVGRELALDTLSECVELGVRAVTMIASGFAETSDPEGVAAQTRLVEIISSSGTRVCGPNTVGVANFNEGVVAIASANIPDQVFKGGAAIVSQSGGNGLTLLNRATSLGIGIGHMATVGNESDVTLDELILYYLSRDDVRTVVCYIESIRNPDTLREVGRMSSESGKPVFVLKGGRTPEGQRTAVAHTGALATSNLMAEAALRQWGLREASGIDALVACAGIAGRFKAPHRCQIGVFGSGGGTSVLASDMLSIRRLNVPMPSERTRQSLKALMSDTTPANPFDPGGQFLTKGRGVLNEGLKIFAADENFDVLVSFLPPLLSARSAVFADAIVDVAKSSPKPNMLMYYGAGELTRETTQLMRENDILVIDPPEAGVEALSLWLRPSPVGGALSAEATSERTRATQAMVASWKSAGRKLINEHDTLTLLETYGLPVPRHRMVRLPDEIDAAFAAVGGPVAVKVLSESLPHRSELGGVVLRVKDAAGARDAFKQVRAAALAHIPPEQIEGVLIEQMLTPGLEMIAGLRRDPSLGTAVVFGFGGVLAELIEDVTVRFPPFSKGEAKAMLGDLRGARLLGGYRSIEGADVDRVVEFLTALGEMAMDLGPEVVAVDLNPVILNRRGVHIADGLIELSV